ncbi:MAG: 4-aminobutyrate--2-oxoglutarate transaminase [Synergistaceae bacterium]|jgi:4-aminobutyrate aminotransferase|nr:4-aminobutyrate--2-oxoglutarate transaminase [Synergistaceae bacterium]
MGKNQELEARRLAATPKGQGVGWPIYAQRAKNAEIWDVEGNRYIDFYGGIGVLNTGHLHPKVRAAVAAQLDRFSHTSYQIVPHEIYITAAERINALIPGPGQKKCAFFNSGAEAVENAVKIARCHTGRAGIIAFNSSFHGRTMMTLALTGKVAPYKLGFGPFPGDVYHVPFPNALHKVGVQDSIEAIDRLLHDAIEAKRVAAVIYEPVQGEGGFNPAPAEFVRAMRELCDKHGIVLIHDEVQCGFGRTGKMFASEHYDAYPDIIVMAKSLGGGFIVSGVAGKAEIMDAPDPGGLGGTYVGNPLSLAAVNAVLDVFAEENLCERSRKLGEICKSRLEKLKADVPQLAEVRGPGSMVAMEFLKPGTGEPDPAFVKKARDIAFENKLLVLSCGPHYNVLRLLYPLTIEDKVFDEGLGILENALRKATA